VLHSQSRTKRVAAAAAGGHPDIRAVLVSSLQERWRKCAAEVARCRQRCTEPAIHDLRVATRRLIATLDMLTAVMGEEETRRVRRDLKKLLKGFNRLRDVHIQVLAVRQFGRRFPVLRSFRASLAVQEHRLVREAGRQIGRLPMKEFDNRIARIQANLETVMSHPGMASAAEAAAVGTAAVAFARATRLRWEVTPSDPQTIHTLRVAFKKFRYTLEITERFLPHTRKPLFKLMNQYQTTLGEVQDAEVLLRNVQEFARGGGSTAHIALLQVVQHLVENRTEKIEEFMKQADRLSDFWEFGPHMTGPEKPAKSARRVSRIRR
jgi:CHAD domain-containing protein